MAVLTTLTTVRAARIKAVGTLIGARREVDMGTRTTTTAIHVTGAAILPLQEDGSRLHLVLRASEPACHPHLRQRITTVMVGVMAVVAISRATPTVADTVPRLHPHMAVDNIKAEVEAVMEEDTKAKGIGSHRHLAAMIIDTEEEVAAVAMEVIGDTIEDMATTKGTETIVTTVVEDEAPRWNASV